LLLFLYTDMSYKDIYQNCKRSYILLKSIQSGSGSNNLIIHISGPSGSGKTTIGTRLKEKFNNKIIVKDIDDLRQDFIKEYYGTKKWKVIDKGAYQKYIDKFVSNYQNKPIIFVGLNNMPWWHKNYYYNMHSNHNYYIDIDDTTIVKQKCLRMFDDFSKNLPNDNFAMNDLVNNNKLFLKLTKQSIDLECDKNRIVKMNKNWNKDYKKQGYKFMSRDNILREVSAILNERRY